MGAILERVSDLAARCGDLGPVANDVQHTLWWGHRDMIVRGLNDDGSAAARTVRQGLTEGHWVSYDRGGKLCRYYQAGLSPGPRAPADGGDGPGPARAPHGDRSRIITRYKVNVIAGVGRLTFVAGYPDDPDWAQIAEYLHAGTPRMPARPHAGFRTQDLDEIRAMLRQYVTDPAPGRGWFGRLFGRGAG